MITAVLATYAVMHLVMFVGSLRWPSPATPTLWWLRVMLLAMMYDNTMMAMGNHWVGSPLYETLNWPRYLAHVVLLPFMTLFVLTMLRRHRMAFAFHPAVVGVAVLMTAGALVYGVVVDLLPLQLEVAEVYGHSRLVSVDKIPPYATIATNAVLLPLTALLWRGGGGGALFAGALFIFIVNGTTGAQPWGFMAGNGAEVVFVFAMLGAELGSPTRVWQSMRPAPLPAEAVTAVANQ